VFNCSTGIYKRYLCGLPDLEGQRVWDWEKGRPQENRSPQSQVRVHLDPLYEKSSAVLMHGGAQSVIDPIGKEVSSVLHGVVK
jgi:hypothetical protein